MTNWRQIATVIICVVIYWLGWEYMGKPYWAILHGRAWETGEELDWKDGHTNGEGSVPRPWFK